MKIIRNGKEIELTKAELWLAHEEMERIYNFEDLENVCEVHEYDLTEDEKETVIERYRDRYESEDWFHPLAYWCEEAIKERKV